MTGAWATWAALILGGGGFAGMVVQIVKARPEAKKIDADAAQVLSSASAEFVQRMATQLDRTQARVDQLEQKLNLQEEREERHERLLLVHEAWDRSVAEKLRGMGETIADPPPLYPDPTAA